MLRTGLLPQEAGQLRFLEKSDLAFGLAYWSELLSNVSSLPIDLSYGPNTYHSEESYFFGPTSFCCDLRGERVSFSVLEGLNRLSWSF